MGKNFRWPRTEEDIQKREAAGLWRAQALAKEIGESNEKITLNTILRLHRVFFEHANPDIAGKFRKIGQDIKKLKCVEPPPGTAVQEQMYGFWRDLDTRLAQVPQHPKGHDGKAYRKALTQRNDVVIDIATWVQYKMASIHPFCEGNGRMARLMTNLILYRFGLQPTDIKYEGENKKAYIEALCAIDHELDYRALRQLITKGMITSYKKLINTQKKAMRRYKK